MGNFITDTLGKMAGNVTQSVVSALIVTAITTYLIVVPGKNRDTKESSGTDSAKSSTTVAPVEKRGGTEETGGSAPKSTEPTTLGKPDADKSVDARGETRTIAVPAGDTKGTQGKAESPATEAAKKAFKELPPENPTEQNLERTITEGRAKGDSLAKTHPQDEKVKDVKKEEKKQTKDVKKRADEVFDELDQEVQK